MDRELEQLHDEYVYRVNTLVEEGREDLARQLSDCYVEDALYLLRREPTD
ncbi:MAG TPA: hypothetical protein VH395_10885 [Jatrophihabitantaceae bacterium]|jgi:hypothetical protein